MADKLDRIGGGYRLRQGGRGLRNWQRSSIGIRRRAAGVPRQIWLVSLTDLICVLLAFFVLKFSMSGPGSEGWNSVLRILGAERGAQNRLVEDLALPERAAVVSVGYLVNVLDYQLGLGEGSFARLWRQGRSAVLGFPYSDLFLNDTETLDGPARPIIDAFAQLARRLDNQIELVAVMSAASGGVEDEQTGVWTLISGLNRIAEVIDQHGYDYELVRSVRLAPVADLDHATREGLRGLTDEGTASIEIIVWDWAARDSDTLRRKAE